MTGLGTIINSDQQRKVYAGGTLSCDRNDHWRTDRN